MTLQYQGEQYGKSTTFTIRIIGNNLSKSSSNYQIDLLVGDKKLPTFTTGIHQSLSNCLKEIYLFRKHHGITFEALDNAFWKELDNIKSTVLSENELLQDLAKK